MATVSFTKDFIHDVGMGDVVAALGRMRILGDHAISRCVAGARLPGPLELDLKRPQIDPV